MWGLFDLLDGSVFVVEEFIEVHAAGIALIAEVAGDGELAVVIRDVPVALILDDGGVVVVAEVLLRVVENRADVFERAGRGIAHQVVDVRGGAELRAVGEVVFAFVLVHEGGFEKLPHVQVDGFREHADHVFVELKDAGLGIAVAAVVHERATVVIDEACGVEEPDGAVVGSVFVNKGLADRIGVGAFGFVGHGHADGVAAVREVEVDFAVADRGAGGVAMACPRGDRLVFAVGALAGAVAEVVAVADGEDEAVVGPVLEVVGGDQFVVEQVITALVGEVMTAYDVDAVIEHESVRVGRVDMADDGLVGFDDADCAHKCTKGREHRFQSFAGHYIAPCCLLGRAIRQDRPVLFFQRCMPILR